MANWNNQGYSSDDIKKLQTALTNNGYSVGSTGVDGQYGNKTASAVSKAGYSSLSDAMNKLVYNNSSTGNTATSNISGVSSNTATNLAKYANGYTPSESVTAAETYLNNLKANKPAEYQSKYTDQLQSIYDKIMNREPFSYDLNADTLYNQYKDQYTRLGQNAMLDTMGQAAGLTGGYGSSYSQNAGQQAYQSYLQNLNDVVPELYSQAYSRYQDEGNDLLNQYNLANTADTTDYNRYRDNVSDYYNDYSNAYNEYANAYSNDNSNWQTMLNYWQNQQSAENSDYWNKVSAAKSSSSSSKTASTGSTKSSLKNAYSSSNGIGYTNSKTGKSATSYTKGSATSLDFDPDEGLFTWNGKKYSNLDSMVADMDTANLSDDEIATINKKLAAYGITDYIGR